MFGLIQWKTCVNVLNIFGCCLEAFSFSSFCTSTEPLNTPEEEAAALEFIYTWILLELNDPRLEYNGTLHNDPRSASTHCKGSVWAVWYILRWWSILYLKSLLSFTSASQTAFVLHDDLFFPFLLWNCPAWTLRHWSHTSWKSRSSRAACLWFPQACMWESGADLTEPTSWLQSYQRAYG